MEVKNNCNGIYESVIFLLAFTAIQLPWRRKWPWILGGFLVFHAINELRLVSLFIIGSNYSHETFVFFHETFWQYALILFTISLFLFCAHQMKKREGGAKTQ
jgi:exosortase/archaeosortase family protein